MAPNRAMANLACLPPALWRLTIHHRAALSFFNPLRFASTETATTRRPSVLSDRPSRPPKPEGPPIPFSYLPTPSNDPNQAALPAPSPPAPALAAATKLFTQIKPRLLFTRDRFLHIPFNTCVPEICLLGRSNVGKSTLINALSGTRASEAGRLHGVAARRAGLAVTSTKAGCTRTMNGYGFGRVDLKVQQAFLAKRAEENKAMGKAPSRTERRKQAKKPREEAPTRALVVVDMPGYGLNSLREWGVEIDKYLKKRANGAVLLVDAEVGLKDGDRMVLKMLRDYNVRTMVMLTKGDKLLKREEARAKFGRTSNGGLDKACVDIWQELRGMELQDGKWTEGNGWDREIWVTGAGDPKQLTGLGVEAARWAICRLAGLLDDPIDSPIEPVPVLVKDAKLGEIVSFDRIVWATAPEPKRTSCVRTSSKDMVSAMVPELGQTRRPRSFKDMVSAAAPAPKRSRARASF